MQDTYKICTSKADPYVQIQLPNEMLSDLKSRARENGRNLNFEIMIRLARTLENDYHRDQFDQVFEKIFFLDDTDHQKSF